jgi:hypothetical protein
MTNDELDFAIAKAKGMYQKLYSVSTNPGVVGEMTWFSASGACLGVYSMQWADNILGAWELVEEMLKNGMRPVIIPDRGGNWQVVLYRCDIMTHAPFPWDYSVSRAICKAYLAWKGYDTTPA